MLVCPVNQEHQGRRAKGWVNRSRSLPVWAGSMLQICLCDRPVSETSLREWPGSSWNGKKLWELCVGLISWEWLWIFNCKVNRRLTARMAYPCRKQSQWWFTVQSWHARTYWENDTVSILILSFVSQCHRSRVKLLLCSWPEKLYGKFDCLQQIAVACSCLFELPKPLSHFTRGTLTPVNANVISAPRVVNGPECRTVVSRLPWMW